MKEIDDNPVLTRVQHLLASQTKKGIDKYGVTIVPDSLSTIEWIDHASEELIDTLVYLQCLRERMKGYERRD